MIFRKKKKINTSAEDKLEKLKNLLFPPLEVKQEIDKEGNLIKFHIDYSVDTNLDSVLMDLQEGYNDPACQKTLDTIIKRLNDARRLLEAFAELDKDAKYIIVDDGGKDQDVSAAED